MPKLLDNHNERGLRGGGQDIQLKSLGLETCTKIILLKNYVLWAMGQRQFSCLFAFYCLTFLT